MLKIVADEAVHEDLAAGLDESCARVRGGCWPPRWKTRSPPTSPRTPPSGMGTGGGRWCATGMPAARSDDGGRGAGGPAPRVDDRRVDEAAGERARFRSSILPPWRRKSPKITKVLPLLYLHGLSIKDFVPALEQFLGSGGGPVRLGDHLPDRDVAGGAPALVRAGPVRCRLRVLLGRWAHFGVRLDADRVCTLVVIGVRADGKKELVALTDGHRESAESWAGLLRDARRRGMRAPVLAVGDGTLGFSAALAEVFPETRQGHCWVHKVVNTLDCLPKSAQPAAREALAQIREQAGKAVKYPQGRRQDHRRPGATARVLRLPGRALDPPQDVQPDRYLHLLHGQAPDPGHPGTRLPGGRAGHGVQTHRGGQRTLALRQRPAPGRPRPGRGQVREGSARRAARRGRDQGSRVIKSGHAIHNS
jgi:putative transposase